MLLAVIEREGKEASSDVIRPVLNCVAYLSAQLAYLKHQNKCNGLLCQLSVCIITEPGVGAA